jgi:beta-galactosidase
MVIVSYVQKYDELWEKAGYELGFTQFEISKEHVIKNAVDKEHLGSISVDNNDHFTYLKGEDFYYIFSNAYGMFTKLEYRGIDMIKTMPKFNIWRAPTDNDRNVKRKWMEAFYDHASTHIYKVSVLEQTKSYIKIACDFSVGGPVRSPAIKGTACWSVYSNGEIVLNVKTDRIEKRVYLPRFGLQLMMPSTNEKVEYFGYGPQESYIDKHIGAKKSRYKTEVSDLHEPYVKPQENGSHYATQWLTVTDELGFGLLFKGMDEFSFNVSHYTPEDLTQTLHNHELKKRAETIVNIDYFNSGIGSNSCGPELAPEYRLENKCVEFNLAILPILKPETDIMVQVNTIIV